MIVDSQVHLGLNMDGSFCSAEDALAEARAAGVDRIVQVTGASNGWSNDYSFEAVEQNPDGILGLFGRFDPLAPDVERRLREFQALPGVLGVRLTSKDSGGPTGLADRVFDDYFAAAQKLDVAVQIYAPDQIQGTYETARRFPGVRLLIDHYGIQSACDDIFSNWPDLAALAAEPNVWLKVSYFPKSTTSFGEPYPCPTAQGHFRRMCEHIGTHKLIWTSNYPPVKRVGSYREGLDFIRVHCDFLSPKDLEQILGATFLANFAPKLSVR